MKSGRGVLAAVSVSVAMAMSANAASAAVYIHQLNIGQLAGGQSGSVSGSLKHRGPYDLFFSFKLTTPAKVMDVFSESASSVIDSINLYAGGGACHQGCSGGTLVPGAGATGSGTVSTPWTNTLDAGRYYFEVLTGEFPATSKFQFAFYDTVNTQAVPEPATWSMMILGVGLVGAGLRRRARKASVAAA